MIYGRRFPVKNGVAVGKWHPWICSLMTSTQSWPSQSRVLGEQLLASYRSFVYVWSFLFQTCGIKFDKIHKNKP